ncbi:ribosome small subunit-dependent GTPase A [Coprothermobacter platensis]|uniref:ribosome small subunit-dependent GTPase A n=1 Tax=Coprothermobacter platensis TaxID=108819 RepID=UPI000367D274|nr:ribosome small subunit-dependent GTPase A [Coprothermobacter platensis]
MMAFFLGRVLRRERYNVLLSYEGNTYTGLVKRKVLNDGGIFVNDRVWFLPADGNTASVERVAGRKNVFLRPPVANIDLLLYVHSFISPACDIKYLDLTLGLARQNNVDAVVLFHKSDLYADGFLEPWEHLYQRLGYRVLSTSIYKDLSELKRMIQGKTVLFTGQSGVGKSSLVKALWGYEKARVADVSHAGRGKHTTTWVELMHMDNTWFVDAPGFALLEMPAMRPRDVQQLFPEIEEASADCYYSDCLHLHEPQCAVKKAVSLGQISQSRYDSYCYFLTKQQEEAKK